MNRTTLGRSSLSVHRVGLGTMGLGGYFEADFSRDDAVVAALVAGFEAGANLVDTAEIYGAGHAEALVGKAIQGRREHVVVATKFSPEHSTFRGVITAAEESLRRLNTDYIDLYQTHWPNLAVPFEETLSALQLLAKTGKIKTVGLSNATRQQIRLVQAALGPDRFVSLQQQYNLADRLVERSHLPECKANGLTLLAYSPLLEGKLVPADGRKEPLEQLATEMGCALGQLILAWLLRNPEVVVIPKAASARHLLQNLAAAELDLPDALCARISDLYRSEVVELPRDRIELADEANRVTYRTVEEARRNSQGMNPSPSAVADSLLAGEEFRPVKVREIGGSSGRYRLSEGRLRYWAWAIAYGEERPVPCVVI